MQFEMFVHNIGVGHIYCSIIYIVFDCWTMTVSTFFNRLTRLIYILDIASIAFHTVYYIVSFAKINGGFITNKFPILYSNNQQFCMRGCWNMLCDICVFIYNEGNYMATNNLNNTNHVKFWRNFILVQH